METLLFGLMWNWVLVGAGSVLLWPRKFVLPQYADFGSIVKFLGTWCFSSIPCAVGFNAKSLRIIYGWGPFSVVIIVTLLAALAVFSCFCKKNHFHSMRLYFFYEITCGCVFQKPVGLSFWSGRFNETRVCPPPGPGEKILHNGTAVPLLYRIDDDGTNCTKVFNDGMSGFRNASQFEASRREYALSTHCSI